jgi:hypothetical protein
MQCPNCEKDTSANEPYCIHCGLAIDLDFSIVEDAFGEEAEEKAVRDTELTARKYLYLALGFLVIVLGAWLVLVPEIPRPRAVPEHLVAPALDAPAVPPMPLPRLELEIPQ